MNMRVLACDVSPDWSTACQLADTHFKVPRVSDDAYIPTLLEQAKLQEVNLIVPTIDPELAPLADARDAFEAIGTRIHVSERSAIDVARDKKRTAQVLAQAGVPVPKTLDEAQLRANPQALAWPVFAKPAGGSAGRGLAVFETPEDIPDGFPEPMVFQQYLTGPEYTVNAFVDRDGTLACVVPHLRKQIRAGEVEKGRTVRSDEYHAIASSVAHALPGLRGAFCFQLLHDPTHGPCVIEVNARFGGGYPLADHAGGKFAQWLLEEITEKPSTARNDTWRDGAEMLRYDAAVFRG